MDETSSARYDTSCSSSSIAEKEKPSLTDDIENDSLPLIEPEPKGIREIIKKWPKSSFCIIGNEFCERFSFIGMKSVLTLYVLNILAFDDNSATVLFHAFITVCYLTPLLGSILADGYIGKFWTILSLSLVYAAGNVTLAIASTFSKTSSVHPYLDIAGLMIIGIGTGGIKPCVCAFGGDQFNQNHLHMLSIFFSVFYFTVNAGSMISSLVTPLMRAIPCNGSDSCYPMAFGVPAGLMVVATLIFVSGSIAYKKIPPKENVFARVFGTVWTAVRNKITSKSPRSHWLEHSLDTHNCDSNPRCIALRKRGKPTDDKCAQKRFVEDVKSLIRVIIVLIPVPFFWSLYDQQGSRWIIQAVAMDAKITDSFSVLPDQMITMNSLFVLILIPVFQSFVYPMVEKCGIRTTPLRRLVFGGYLGAVSFVICGFLQLGVNRTLPDVPNSNTAFVSVINTYSNCNITVTAPGLPQKFILSDSSLIDDKVKGLSELYRVESAGQTVVPFKVSFEGAQCAVREASYDAHVEGGKSFYVIVSPEGITQGEAQWMKPTEGAGQSSMSINLMLPCSMVPSSVTWAKCRAHNSTAYAARIAVCAVTDRDHHPCDPLASDFYSWGTDEGSVQKVVRYDGSVFYATHYDFKDVRPARYQGYYVYYNSSVEGTTPAAADVTAVPIDGFAFTLDTMGGVYTFTIDAQNRSSQLKPKMNVHMIVPPNHLSIMWQVPQYVVLSAAEVLFSITGLEFAYSQAAPSMKSVVQAIWLLTVTFGDLIIIIISELDMFSDLATEMFAYAGGLVVVITIFALMSVFYYQYADFSADIAESVSSGTDNSSFEDDDAVSVEKAKL